MCLEAYYMPWIWALGPWNILSASTVSCWASHSIMLSLISRKFVLRMESIIWTTWNGVVITPTKIWTLTSLPRSSPMWISLRVAPRFYLLLFLSYIITTLRSWRRLGKICMMWIYPILLVNIYMTVAQFSRTSFSIWMILETSITIICPMLHVSRSILHAMNLSSGTLKHSVRKYCELLNITDADVLEPSEKG